MTYPSFKELPMRSPAEFLREYVNRLGIAEGEHTPDLEFWGQNPPAEIVLCTSSVRKGMMAASLLRLHAIEISGRQRDSVEIRELFPVEKAQELIYWFKEFVANGDGTLALGETYLLGHYYGVPIYLRPTQGESNANDQPSLEALAKAVSGRASHLQELGHAPAPRKVFVGMDTVENVVHPDGTVGTYGKPAKEPGYPTHGTPEEVFAFEREYIAEKYPEEASVLHIAAIAILSGKAGVFEGDTAHTKELHLPYHITPEIAEIFKTIRLDKDSGGGGMTQQLLKHFEQFKDAEPIEILIMLCRIMGMPLHGILEFIREKMQIGPGEREAVAFA